MLDFMVAAAETAKEVAPGMVAVGGAAAIVLVVERIVPFLRPNRKNGGLKREDLPCAVHGERVATLEGMVPEISRRLAVIEKHILDRKEAER